MAHIQNLGKTQKSETQISKPQNKETPISRPKKANPTISKPQNQKTLTPTPSLWFAATAYAISNSDGVGVNKQTSK